MSFGSQKSLRVNFSHFRAIFFRHLGCSTVLRKRGCLFEESTEFLYFFYKQPRLMARFSAQDVLDRVWNDSGDEGSISDSDYARGNSNSDSESDEWSGDSAESSESSDTESGNESEESDN